MSNYRRFKLWFTFLLVFAMTSIFTPHLLASANNVLYQFEPDSSYTQTDIKAVFRVNSSYPQPIIDWESLDGQPLRCHPIGGSGCTTYIEYSTNGTPISVRGEFFISGQERPSGTYTAIYTYCAAFVYGTTICSWRGELVRANFTIDAYTISGTVGTAGAILNYIDGTAKKVTADGSGKYTISVTGGWSGKVTPSKGGYIFSPSSKTYSSLVENKADQNYGAVEAYMTFMPLLTR